MIIDSHCHIYDIKLDAERQQILQALNEKAQVAICSGDNIKNSKACIDLAAANKNIFATVGLHPHEAYSFNNELLSELEVLSHNEKVVAIGEIGLDYYYDFSPREIQKEALQKQILLAEKLGLPCVFHVRDAMGDFLDIIKSMAQKHKIRGVIHSFSGSVETAKELVKMGFYLGINGIITFNNAKHSIDVVKEIDLKYLLIETDSPYLTPVPYRGQVNKPEYVELVAKKVAEIKVVSIKQVLDQTTTNAIKLFKLKV